MNRNLCMADAKKWSMSVFAETQAKGHYTASNYAQLPGAGFFHTASKELGYTQRSTTYNGRRNKWVLDHAPTNDEIEALFNIADNPDSINKALSERLNSIESKLDDLLSVWR